MSRVLRNILIEFQWFRTYAGGSTRHGRNMGKEADEALLAAYYARESEALKRAWDAGNHLPDLYQAVVFCTAYSIPLFDWCGVAVLNLIIATYNGDKPGEEGRFGQPRAKFKNHYRHIRRWEVLRAEVRSLGLNPVLTLDRKRGAPPKDIARKLAEAFKATADRLNKADPRDTPTRKQIKESYRTVESWRAEGNATLKAVIRNSPRT